MASGSPAASGPSHRTSSWIVVVLISVAAIVLGFAFVMQSVPLAVLGGVVGLVGVVMGIATNIMDDVH